MNKEYLTTSELAKLLGISRVAVFKKIKSGEIKAERIGRNFVIKRSKAAAAIGLSLKESKKRRIDAVVKRAVKEYGEALKLLGQE